MQKLNKRKIKSKSVVARSGRRRGPAFPRRDFKMKPALETQVSTVVVSDTVTFLSKQISTWFVRYQNHFYDVDRLNTGLPLPHLQKICVQRIARNFPKLTVTSEVLKQVFQRVITETHDDQEQSIPIWDGTTRCCPGNDARIIRDGEMVSINTWRTPEYRNLGVQDTESAWFHNFLARVFPQAADRAVFVDWLSWCLQNEGDKPGWAPFLYSRKKGTGKSTLCRLAEKLFGAENTITQNSVSKLTGRFNKPLLDSKLIISEELQLKPDSTQGNTLKTYITEKATTSEVKGREVEKVKQYCCFLFTTNHLPLWIEADERRYYVIEVDHSGHASGPDAEAFGDAVAEFCAIMDDPANIARLYNALLRHQQSNSFNACTLNLSAIDTPVMKQIMGASKEVQLQQLDELLAEKGVFAIGQGDLARVFAEDLKMNANRIKYMMPDLGWRSETTKWGGVDYARAIWVHRDYQVSGGRVRGPDGYDAAVGQEAFDVEVVEAGSTDPTPDEIEFVQTAITENDY